MRENKEPGAIQLILSAGNCVTSVKCGKMRPLAPWNQFLRENVHHWLTNGKHENDTLGRSRLSIYICNYKIQSK